MAVFEAEESSCISFLASLDTKALWASQTRFFCVLRYCGTKHRELRVHESMSLSNFVGQSKYFAKPGPGNKNDAPKLGVQLHY